MQDVNEDWLRAWEEQPRPRPHAFPVGTVFRRPVDGCLSRVHELTNHMPERLYVVVFLKGGFTGCLLNEGVLRAFWSLATWSEAEAFALM